LNRSEVILPKISLQVDGVQVAALTPQVFNTHSVAMIKKQVESLAEKTFADIAETMQRIRKEVNHRSITRPGYPSSHTGPLIPKIELYVQGDRPFLTEPIMVDLKENADTLVDGITETLQEALYGRVSAVLTTVPITVKRNRDEAKICMMTSTYAYRWIFPLSTSLFTNGEHNIRYGGKLHTALCILDTSKYTGYAYVEPVTRTALVHLGLATMKKDKVSITKKGKELLLRLHEVDPTTREDLAYGFGTALLGRQLRTEYITFKMKRRGLSVSEFNEYSETPYLQHAAAEKYIEIVWPDEGESTRRFKLTEKGKTWMEEHAAFMWERLARRRATYKLKNLIPFLSEEYLPAFLVSENEEIRERAKARAAELTVRE